MDRNPKIEKAALNLDKHCEAMTAGFQSELEEIVLKAQAATAAALQKMLDMSGSTILNTPANNRVLRKADNLFVDEMKKAGYKDLVSGFVSEFNGTLPYFQATVDAITATWKEPPPPVEFDADDLKLFTHFQLSAKQALNDVVTTIGSQATLKATFSVGGMEFGDLTAMLAKQFSKTIPQATTIASTSVPTYYRTVADQGFQKIEEELPPSRQLYVYYGPDDKLTRPFCVKVLASNRPYTRAEISAMDNGQLPNPMVTCGGFNCRHQWILYDPGRGR